MRGISECRKGLRANFQFLLEENQYTISEIQEDILNKIFWNLAKYQRKQLKNMKVASTGRVADCCGGGMDKKLPFYAWYHYLLIFKTFAKIALRKRHTSFFLNFCNQEEFSIYCWWHCKLHYLKNYISKYSKNDKAFVCFDPSITFMAIYHKERIQ